MTFLPVVASSSAEKSRAPHNELVRTWLCCIILLAVKKKKIVYYIRPRNRRYYYIVLEILRPSCVYSRGSIVLLLYPGQFVSVSVRIYTDARKLYI